MAYNFTSGSSQYLSGSNTSAYNFGDAVFTVSFLIKTTATTNNAVIAKGANSASDKGWLINIGNSVSGRVTAQLKRGSGDNFTAAQRDSVATVNDGAWHSVVITFVTSSASVLAIDLNLYIDGSLSQGVLTAIDVYNGGSTSNLSIGCRGSPAGPSNFLSGDVAEVGIWGVILDAGEITALSKFSSPINIRPASRVAYFPMVLELIEIQQALGLTNNNSAVASSHPPIYGP